jgi:AcrR family transcriptional regulator
MADEQSSDEPRYHHGDLGNTLRQVAADLIAERGVAGFSLREVARRAGVSHAAPGHHFGDASGLLTAVAIEAFDHLHDATSAAIEGIDDPSDRLAMLARAYVEVATTNPGHCAVAFRHDLLDNDDADLLAAGDRAYAVLSDVVQHVADTVNPDLDVVNTSRLCWSSMQGLIELHPSMNVVSEHRGEPAPPPIGDLAEIMARQAYAGFEN